MNNDFRGEIHILKVSNDNIYKLEKTNFLIRKISPWEIIETYEMNDIFRAEVLLKKILSKFNTFGNTYKCECFWIQLACTLVQRIINQDENIMDVDLPF